MDRRQRSVVACRSACFRAAISRFLASNLANDDAVRTHTQWCWMATSLRWRTAPLPSMFWRTAPGADNVLLLHLKFGGIFDRDDALVVTDVSAHYVQQSRLASARAAGNDDVGFALTAAFNASKIGADQPAPS